MLPAVGFIRLKQNTETTWNSSSVCTLKKNKTVDVRLKRAPTVGSFVLFEFYFMMCDGLNEALLKRGWCNCVGIILWFFQKRASDRVEIDDRKSKSFEEREERYVETRNRIFHQQHSVSWWYFLRILTNYFIMCQYLNEFQLVLLCSGLWTWRFRKESLGGSFELDSFQASLFRFSGAKALKCRKLSQHRHCDVFTSANAQRCISLFVNMWMDFYGIHHPPLCRVMSSLRSFYSA